MQKAELVEFDPELWDPEKLQLTQLQIESLPLLQEVLLKSELALSSVLRRSEPRTWNSKEMHSLEKEVLAKVGKGPSLKCTFDILAKVAVRHRFLTNTKGALPRPLHPVKLEKSPFHEVDLVGAERIVTGVKAWLVNDVNESALELATKRDEVHPSPVQNDAGMLNRWQDLRLLNLAILSSIVNLHVLHKSALVSLIEALATREQSFVSAGQNSGAWILSLSWGGDDDAERRLLVPDLLTGTLLARASEEPVREAYSEGLARKRPLKLRHKFILSTIEQQIESLFRSLNFENAPSLNEIIDAARTVSYLHMPAAVAALRCRKTVSHIPRREVLCRIFSGTPVNEAALPIGAQPTEVELTQDVDPEVSDTTEAEPIWVQAMRDAFRTKKTRKPLVDELTLIAQRVAGSGVSSKDIDLSGQRIAEFAIWLLSKDPQHRGNAALSTAKRYSLLIARRLGGRLKKRDPLTVGINELEDRYREVLDDDWENPGHDQDYESPIRNKRATVESILRFHKFLRERGKELNIEVPALQELAPVLKRRGLLPVDANFITIDEYRRVLAAIRRHVNDPRIRKSLCLMVILGFRCGLRRRELFYLRVEDLDAAEHLYVRSYNLRKVKTTNSNRAIPYGILLDADEKRALMDFISGRKNGRIFTSEDGREFIGEEKAFELIHVEMRRELQDNSLRFHHLRHSFATLLVAKLMSGTEDFVRHFLIRHPDTQEWMAQRDSFRVQLFGNVHTRSLDIQAIAHLLGHGGCAVGVENYIHSLDWCRAATPPMDFKNA